MIYAESGIIEEEAVFSTRHMKVKRMQSGSS